MLVQGIIDVFWMENDKIILLDYKTDRVKQAQELLMRYQTQLQLYADALSRVFSTDTKKMVAEEKLIYSFHIMSRIVLASASPRRKELLEQIGLEFEICPAKGEEVITAGSVDGAVLELSRQKAEEVAAGILSYNEIHPELVTPQDILVIGADTVVACDGNILGKPRDEADAAHMLSMLSGHTHSVYTGVTLVFIDKNGRTGETSFYEKTDVCMYPLDDAEIRRYIAGGEPMDKAGSYGIQGQAAAFVKEIHGDYNNVVGLPVGRLYQELKKLGVMEWN